MSQRNRSIIKITTSYEYQQAAASKLSTSLDTLGIPHAYIGGFAWSLLGSSRPTQDIDVLIESPANNLEELRDELMKLDPHFVQAIFKLYLVQELPEQHLPIQPGIDDIDRLCRSDNNVLIETLQTGHLGLPVCAEPVYHVDGNRIPILHPSIIIFTKLSRWWTNYTSTRPKTMAKSASDHADIRYLIQWMADKHFHIAFDRYTGKSRTQLLRLVRTYWDHSSVQGEEDIIVVLKTIMAEEDVREIEQDQQREGNLAVQALNRSDPPP